jgi:tetratricopeptide (TPR) repeat protein
MRTRPHPKNRKQHSRAVTANLIPRRDGSGPRAIALCLILAALTLVVFGQTIRYEFVNFDDDVYIYNALIIRAGITMPGLLRAFTAAHASNWHPLTTLSHMIDCQLYGLDAGGHHATNVLFHTLAVLLLFYALWQLTGSFWRSATVSALFAVHPLHVESVAWVSERKDVLSAVCFMLILLAYAYYARAPSIWRYVIVIVIFACGLMSKPMLVTAPVILLLLDYWPLRRFGGEHCGRAKTAARCVRPGVINKERRPTVGYLVLEKAPLAILATAVCIVTFVLQKRSAGAIPSLPFLWRAGNAILSYLIYLWQTLWPLRLAVFYPYPGGRLSFWTVLGAAIVLAGISVTVVILRRKRPYLLTGWLWHLVMLVPVIGIVQVGEQAHADRYVYLPHIGLFLMIVWLVADEVERRQGARQVAAGATVVVIAALAARAFNQVSYWRNSETLWSHALAVTSGNDVAHNNLGYLCADRGDLDEAIRHFQAAAAIRATKREAHYDTGSAFIQMNLADAFARKGQRDEAIRHYDEALRLQPYYADAYYNRGNVLLTMGRTNEAIADLEKALQLQPHHADAHTCLGNAFLQKNFVREAVAHYEQAVELAPEDPHSRNNLAWILATASDSSIRDGTKAVELAEQAVTLSGGKEPQFTRTLAAAYAADNRFTDAIATAQQAILEAKMQGKTALSQTVEQDLILYRSHIPLRKTASPN